MIKHKLAITLGLAVALTLCGAGASYAFWSVPVSAGGSVAAKTISITETMPASFGGTLSSSTPIAGAITITNNGTVTGTYASSVTISGLSSGTLAAAVNVVAWTTTNPSAANCITPTGTTVSGTWASFPALTGSLAPGAAVSYCVKSSLGSTSGLATSTVMPTITATLTAGTNWNASAAVNATQSYTAPPPSATWYQLKNVATQRCAYVSSTTAATTIVSATCSAPVALDGQAFKLSQSGATSIVTYVAQTLGIANSSAGNNKPAVTALTTSGSNQTWTVNQTGADYVFTNAGNSRCLADDSSSAGSALTLDNCATTATQQFTLEPIQ
ncbi:RICIN domain-containing protein [Rathayibacter soli]|uniref:RICIN domain-containing protein n=1 Tax=Rathayibacter soli TaxID=3144168 RepID=UPI0027E4B58A|nr:RICIN domain-containing protein [Glaciibacter superstes]